MNAQTLVSPLNPASDLEPSPVGQPPVLDFEPATDAADPAKPVEPAAPAVDKGAGSDIRALDNLAKKLKADAPEPIVDPKPKPVEVVDPLLAKASELFSDVKLPEGAKPKSADAFAQVKSRAAEEVAKAIAEQAKLQEEIEQLRKIAEEAKKVDPEILKEVEDLRNFRASVDVETHPEIKKYTDQKASLEKILYTGFENAGVSKEIIEEIRKYGGFTEVDLTNVIAGLPESVHKTGAVAKLAELGYLERERTEKLGQLKESAAEVVKKRREEYEAQFADLNTRLERSVLAQKSEIPWLQLKEVPPTAAPDEKAVIEAHNARAARAQKDLDQIVKETSDEARTAGVFALVYVDLLQEQANKERKVFAAQKEASDKKITELEAQLRSIRESSRRLPSGLDGGGPGVAPAPKAINLALTDEQALDAIAARRMNQ